MNIRPASSRAARPGGVPIPAGGRRPPGSARNRNQRLPNSTSRRTSFSTRVPQGESRCSDTVWSGCTSPCRVSVWAFHDQAGSPGPVCTGIAGRCCAARFSVFRGPGAPCRCTPAFPATDRERLRVASSAAPVPAISTVSMAAREVSASVPSSSAMSSAWVLRVLRTVCRARESPKLDER